MRRSLLAIALTIALPVHAEITVLNCAKMFDSRTGKMLDARSIAVRDGKVLEVTGAGEPGTTYTDTEVRMIELQTCLPGWTDLHVHLRDQSNPASYSEGFRLNRDL